MKNKLLRRVRYCLGFLLATSPLYGQVSFFQPPSYSGVGSSFSADFNGDGKLDLLSSDGTLQLGKGDGTFTTGTQVSGTPLAVADFNGDGKPDVLESGTGTLLVLPGNGDGTFKAAITTASGAVLESVAATDLNGDGKADVVGIFGSNLVVYLSKGDGTFAAGGSYALGVATPVSSVLTFADFNGDGKTDVAVSMTTFTAVNPEIVFLGNGDGTFQAAKTSAGIPSTTNAISGDFNGDGKPDLALEACNEICNTSILTGNGDGTFQAPPLSIPNAGGTLAAADLNGDGKLDLVVEIAGAAGQIFFGNGDGTFSNGNTYVLNFLSAFSGPSLVDGGISIADFNLDGKPDIAIGNNILLGNGNGTFQGVLMTDISGIDTPLAAVGKFDNRQSAPGVAAALNLDVDIFANDGKGGLSLSHTYANALNAPATQVVTGDFNGDGRLDLLLVTVDPTGAWGYCVLLGNGDGSFQASMSHPQGVQSVSGAISVAVGDFNNDKKLDVAVGGLSPQSLAMLLGKGDGTFAPATYVFDGGGDKVMAADFNGDGNLDIAAGVTTQTALNETIETALLLGKGDGTFQAAFFPPSLSTFGARFTAILTNNGHADLVSRNQVALGNGDGTFTLGLQLPFFRLGAADFNGDGIPDLLVSPDQLTNEQVVPPNQTGVLLGNGDGTFSTTNDYITKNGSILTPLIADMNNDGLPDLVFSVPSLAFGTTSSGSGGDFSGIGVLLNTTPANFSLAATALSPSTVTAGSSSSINIKVDRDLGFNQTVTLTCSGLPSGATCAFNPASVPGGTAMSSLTISTASNTAAGTYPIEVQGSAGTLTRQVGLTLIVQAAPDFAISGPATASESINVGQSAMFSLSLAPAGSFSAAVNLGCTITPAVTPAPTCSLSGSAVQLSGTAPQTVTVTVGTTASAATTAQTENRTRFPMAAMPLLGLAGLLVLRKRKYLSMLSAVLLLSAFTALVGCGPGGGMSTHPQTSPGTPTGTYTVTVTAASGSLTHNAVLQVIVQ